MGRGKHGSVPKHQRTIRLPDWVWDDLLKLGDGKGASAAVMELHAWWVADGMKKVERLKKFIDQPPVCKICGKPMKAEIFPANVNLNCTAVQQAIQWTCPKCYDMYEVDCGYPEPTHTTKSDTKRRFL